MDPQFLELKQLIRECCDKILEYFNHLQSEQDFAEAEDEEDDQCASLPSQNENCSTAPGYSNEAGQLQTLFFMSESVLICPKKYKPIGENLMEGLGSVELLFGEKLPQMLVALAVQWFGTDPACQIFDLCIWFQLVAGVT